MKVISIILGILVILSWLFVMREYRKGNEKRKNKLVILIACLLTFIMTLMNFFD